jgi:hypothetical protein
MKIKFELNHKTYSSVHMIKTIHLKIDQNQNVIKAQELSRSKNIRSNAYSDFKKSCFFINNDGQLELSAD